MKYKAGITIFTATTLALTAISGFSQGRVQSGGKMDRGHQVQQDRTYDRDRQQDRDRVDAPARDRAMDRSQRQDFSKLQDQDIYGHEVMSVQERNHYRAQLQNANSVQEQEQLQARHKDQMQARAKAQGIELARPGSGIYGGELMSIEERNRYREELRMIDSQENRAKFTAQHREEMQIRAKLQGIALEERAETEEAE